jgi:hypothetical protein
MSASTQGYDSEEVGEVTGKWMVALLNGYERLEGRNWTGDGARNSR